MIESKGVENGKRGVAASLVAAGLFSVAGACGTQGTLASASPTKGYPGAVPASAPSEPVVDRPAIPSAPTAPAAPAMPSTPAAPAAPPAPTVTASSSANLAPPPPPPPPVMQREAPAYRPAGDAPMPIQTERSFPPPRASQSSSHHYNAPSSTEGSFRFVVRGVPPDDVLNIRSGPNPKYDIVGTIPPDATGVIGIGGRRQIGPSVWREVKYRGMRGWVNDRFLVDERDADAADDRDRDRDRGRNRTRDRDRDRDDDRDRDRDRDRDDR